MLQLLRDAGHFSPCAFYRYAIAQPRYYLQEMIAPLAPLFGGKSHRNPDIHRIWEIEARRQDSDHRVLFAAQQDGFAHDLRARSIAAHPQPAAQQDDARSARLVLFRQKRAAHNGFHPYEREEIGGGYFGFDLFRLAVSGEVHQVAAHGGHVLKNMIAVFPIDEVRGRRRVLWEAHERQIFPDHDEAIRIPERQWPKQYRVDDAEDRSVGADAESQCQCSRRGEGRTLP